jgi:hypothetical protein
LLLLVGWSASAGAAGWEAARFGLAFPHGELVRPEVSPTVGTTVGLVLPGVTLFAGARKTFVTLAAEGVTLYELDVRLGARRSIWRRGRFALTAEAGVVGGLLSARQTSGTDPASASEIGWGVDGEVAARWHLTRAMSISAAVGYEWIVFKGDARWLTTGIGLSFGR